MARPTPNPRIPCSSPLLSPGVPCGPPPHTKFSATNRAPQSQSPLGQPCPQSQNPLGNHVLLNPRSLCQLPHPRIHRGTQPRARTCLRGARGPAPPGCARRIPPGAGGAAGEISSAARLPGRGRGPGRVGAGGRGAGTLSSSAAARVMAGGATLVPPTPPGAVGGVGGVRARHAGIGSRPARMSCVEGEAGGRKEHIHLGSLDYGRRTWSQTTAAGRGGGEPFCLGDVSLRAMGGWEVMDCTIRDMTKRAGLCHHGHGKRGRDVPLYEWKQVVDCTTVDKASVGGAAGCTTVATARGKQLDVDCTIVVMAKKRAGGRIGCGLYHCDLPKGEEQGRGLYHCSPVKGWGEIRCGLYYHNHCKWGGWREKWVDYIIMTCKRADCIVLLQVIKGNLGCTIIGRGRGCSANGAARPNPPPASAGHCRQTGQLSCVHGPLFLQGSCRNRSTHLAPHPCRYITSMKAQSRAQGTQRPWAKHQTQQPPLPSLSAENTGGPTFSPTPTHT